MSDDERVRATAYRPPSTPPRRRRAWSRPLPWLLGAALLFLALAAWFIFTARAVSLKVTPPPDSVAIHGGLSLPLGGRRLLRPGKYTVVVDKAGYRRLSQPITVTANGDHRFRFVLHKLPGRLAVHATPRGTAVSVDGKPVGTTPLRPIKLAPGKHKITVRAPRYQNFTHTLTIAGKNKLQKLTARLVPAWAPVKMTSRPAGATLLVDGHARGKTPMTARIGAGDHQLALRLEGYQRWRHHLKVVANQPQTLPPVKLAKAPGQVTVTSDPAGAAVNAAGRFRGVTPATLDLAPGKTATVKISKAGYATATRQISVASGDGKKIAATLAPILGEVEVAVAPPDAAVAVDGKSRGSGSQTLALTATAHKITIAKPGYVAFATTVTPKPGMAQRVTAHLLTQTQAKADKLAKTIKSPAGGALRLIAPGRFSLGAPRREQGARANEVRRDVVLTRAFYLGEREVTNAQFREFRSAHSSGIVDDETLDNDDQPVVRISWADAVAYCNWLSKRAGLPAAYRHGQLVTPVATGYRLPTEAEWAWAARFAGGRHLKYPWGNHMPPTGSAGNYADTSAAGLVPIVLDDYNDGYAATAPVGRFAANALGLFDMGGNVAEWVNDRYSGGIGLGGSVETDPTGPAGGSAHVVRGSSWRDATITELRLSYRQAAQSGRDDLGFRVARYAQKSGR